MRYVGITSPPDTQGLVQGEVRQLMGSAALPQGGTQPKHTNGAVSLRLLVLNLGYWQGHLYLLTRLINSGQELGQRPAGATTQ